MWLQHLHHFIVACADVFIRSLGSTWLGFAINVLFAIGTTAITLYIVRRKRGKEAMIMHWREELRTAFLVGLTCAAVLYVPLIFYSVGKAVYEDHENLVQVSTGQREAIKRIGTEPLAPTILEMSVPPENDKRKTFVYLANKTIVPAVVIVHCDGPVEDLQGWILDSKVMIARGAYHAPGDTKTWMFEIDAPAWTPTSPLMISYKYTTAIAPKCSFEPKEQK